MEKQGGAFAPSRAIVAVITDGAVKPCYTRAIRWQQNANLSSPTKGTQRTAAKSRGVPGNEYEGMWEKGPNHTGGGLLATSKNNRKNYNDFFAGSVSR